MTEETKRVKFARLVFKSVSLGRVLDELRKHYLAEEKPESLAIPYVLTCAAYLESKLNDSLLEHSRKHFGDDVSEGLMGLSLPSKLRSLVPLLTNGKYRINKQHFVYERLISLIRVRNSIAHAKSELEELEPKPQDLVSLPVLMSGAVKIPKQFRNLPDVTLGATKTFTPLEYHEALDKLDKWFFRRCPDRLRRVAMVVDRSTDNEWEEMYSTWIKPLK